MFLAGLSLYVITLAPTVLWGDDAELQRVAWAGGEIERGHQLWIAIAQAFARIPWGDPARRANLVSAFFAALTLLFVYAAIIQLTRWRVAGFLGAGALAVSHTFWLHAVRAEVYSLYTALFAAILWLLLTWRGRPAEARFLFGAGFLAGLALLSHRLILTALPGLVTLVWWSPAQRRHRARALGMAGLAFVAGALPYLLVEGSGVGRTGRLGYGMLANLLSVRPRDVVLWAGFLGYQFGPGLLLGFIGLRALWRHDRGAALGLALIYLGDVVFSLSFRVPDQFVFYLPSYVVFAIWIALGVAAARDWLDGRLSRLLFVAMILVALPVAAYRATPAMLNRLGVNLLGVRTLPNRDNNTYFLWPPKNGYTGAHDFAETTLRSLPPNAAVLADWLPMQALRYVQAVEGQRPDVEIVEAHGGQGRQVAWLVEQSRTRPVFIADIGRYYNMAEIQERFSVEPFSLIYRLEPIK